MQAPAVSVVLPYWNAEPYFRQALESLAGQTFRNFETLMVNNGSSDGSEGIARSFESSDGRFRNLSCPGNLVDALNAGLESSSGKWIARFDSDDICHPERLARQLEAAEAHGTGTVISCRVRSFPDKRVSRGYRSYERWINSLITPSEIERGLFVESPIPHPTAFFGRLEVLKAGGYRSLGLPEDYELWLRLWSKGFSFFRVPETLLAWREREDRLSRVSKDYSLGAFYRVKAMYLKHVDCLRDRRVFVAGTGQCARRLSGHLLREGFMIEAFLSPLEEPVRKTVRGIPVISIGQWEPVKGVPVLAASREPGARERIAWFLEGFGMENWKDYVLCS